MEQFFVSFSTDQGRQKLLQHYPILEEEMNEFIDMDKSYLLFHTSYIDRALQCLQGRVDYVSNIFKEVILQFQRHCGAIRRKANARVEAAQEKLKAELEK